MDINHKIKKYSYKLERASSADRVNYYQGKLNYYQKMNQKMNQTGGLWSAGDEASEGRKLNNLSRANLKNVRDLVRNAGVIKTRLNQLIDENKNIISTDLLNFLRQLNVALGEENIATSIGIDDGNLLAADKGYAGFIVDDPADIDDNNEHNVAGVLGNVLNQE